MTLKYTGEQRGLNPQGTALFKEVDEGDHNIEISGVANNCSVGGTNPRTITASGGETANTTYNVGCVGQIAFMSNRTGNPEIFVMDANGSNPTNLTNDPGRNFLPR